MMVLIMINIQSKHVQNRARAK